MLEINSEHRLNISFVNTADQTTNDIRTFVNILTKCHEETKKMGLSKMFSEEERQLIKDLYDSIVP